MELVSSQAQGDAIISVKIRKINAPSVIFNRERTANVDLTVKVIADDARMDVGLLGYWQVQGDATVRVKIRKINGVGIISIARERVSNLYLVVEATDGEVSIRALGSRRDYHR